MLHLKDDWDYKIADLYNKEHKVQYTCYLDNLARTIGDILEHQYDEEDLEIDLRETENATDFIGDHT